MRTPAWITSCPLLGQLLLGMLVLIDLTLGSRLMTTLSGRPVSIAFDLIVIFGYALLARTMLVPEPEA